jgi:hypothetical protein
MKIEVTDLQTALRHTADHFDHDAEFAGLCQLLRDAADCIDELEERR